jgi:hypothetical protein
LALALGVCQRLLKGINQNIGGRYVTDNATPNKTQEYIFQIVAPRRLKGVELGGHNGQNKKHSVKHTGYLGRTMKTIEEKAFDLFCKLGIVGNAGSVANSLKTIQLALKEQDKDTRHACAEEILKIPGDRIQKVLAHAAVMNCRGGL